jgi:hypothetical protein
MPKFNSQYRIEGDASPEADKNFDALSKLCGFLY